ncbi:MAG: dephospho-CoA kinase [Hyphomicrobiales bacterium]|nr:dephospho-CoA kinase [Hyphomicrobiales bacterium]
MTVVVGLTGSIGMGKSTTAAMFRELGCPVHDADAAVHQLYAGAAVEPVRALFPAAVTGQRVDREALAREVLGRPGRLAELEALIHPLVREAEAKFVEAARASGTPLVVLDIPLLFESGAAARCDRIVVVTAPPEVQRARVLARPGMTEDRFAAILKRQIPDAEKRRRADFIVDTSQGLASARAEVEAIVTRLTADSRSRQGGPAQ